MSRIRADKLVNRAGSGGPQFPYGVADGFSVAGVVTATSFSGPVSGNVTGDLNSTNINVTGVSTLGNVVVGGATTDVVINGDLRVTGIITTGTSSITIDPESERIVVGTALTLGQTQGVQFHTQNLHSAGFEVNNINASGIVTAANVSVGNSITATTFYGSGANLDGIDVTGGHINLGDGVVNEVKVDKLFSPAHNTANRGAKVRFGLQDGAFSGIEVENLEGSNSAANSQNVTIKTHNGNVESHTALTAQFDGKVGIGSTQPAHALDVIGNIRASGQIILPNNYALVGYSQGGANNSLTTGSTSFIDDTSNATVRASFADYQRGDILIFHAIISMGVALTTSGTNYAGHKATLRASNGSTTLDGPYECQIWYRSDNNATKEVESAQGVTMVVSATDTTFNNGDTVYAYIRHKHNPGAGTVNTGLCMWSGLRVVYGFHYRKVA